jgi:hypothetical protein
MSANTTRSWCVLYRILYDDGRSANCAANVDGKTAKEAADEIYSQPLGPHGSIAYVIISVVPWSDDRHKRPVGELFDELFADFEVY